MDGVIFIIIIVVIIIVIVGTSIGLSFIILRIIKNHNYNNLLKLIALSPILIIGYFIYTAFFPTDSFYKEDFKEVTGIKFPENGEILYKTATYPDQHGDYGSTSVVRVDKEFYDGLEGQLKIMGLTAINKNSGTFNFSGFEEEIGAKKIEKEFSKATDDGVFYYVGFLSDKETLIVQRQSW